MWALWSLVPLPLRKHWFWWSSGKRFLLLNWYIYIYIIYIYIYIYVIFIYCYLYYILVYNYILYNIPLYKYRYRYIDIDKAVFLKGIFHELVSIIVDTHCGSVLEIMPKWLWNKNVFYARLLQQFYSKDPFQLYYAYVTSVGFEHSVCREPLLASFLYIPNVWKIGVISVSDIVKIWSSPEIHPAFTDKSTLQTSF